MPDRTYTDEELDAAIADITDPTRFREAQELVARAAPQLQRVLDGGDRRGRLVRRRPRAGGPRGGRRGRPASRRLRSLRTLLAEETRLGMLVGVAVGFELCPRAPPHPNPETHQED